MYKDADRCDSFSTFVEANGQPLLDLALFVSTENYTAVTRPAYSRFLPWPAHFIIPSKQRAAAKLRSDHLGLSALDLDNVDEERVNTGRETTDPIPRSLLSRPKETITSLLSQPQHASQIRLNALTTAFLEPLTNLLAGKRYFLSEDHPTSLDCLIFGYLAIGIYSRLPLSWLADAIKTKSGRLLDFIHENRREFSGAPIDVHKALQIDQDEASVDHPGKENAARGPDEDQLPWHAPKKFGLPEVGNLLLEEVLTSVPVVRHIHGAVHSRARVVNDDSTEKGVAPPEVTRTHYNGVSTTRLSLAVTGLSVAIGYLLYSGIVFHGSEEKGNLENSNLSDFGEAGATLAIFADDTERRSID